ncbi:MAG: hypothetical protein HDS37_04790 [Bacteroides sp.]|nr:hypothetical protein [Bacteroides sp.]
MNTRYISIIILLLSFLSISADKVMTVRNSDTGESFEVSVPDGLRIYKYNSNWLDSIPYLLERARYGEPWAYEALGDCYRYGKGGVERSIIKALVYYVMSEMDVDGMAKNSVKENPHDHLSLFYKLIERWDDKDDEGMLGVIDKLEEEGYHDADVLKSLMGDTTPENIISLVEQSIISPDVSTDEMLFTVLRYGLFEALDLCGNKEELFIAACNKFPYIYDKAGMKILKEDSLYIDLKEDEKMRLKAISFLREADKSAFLSRQGAAILYRHYKSEIEGGRMEYDEVEMERLATLARLPESEIFVVTDK